jgi:hypothetical protein
MPEPYADTLATVAAGRTATVTRLRTLAALSYDNTPPRGGAAAVRGLADRAEPK